MNTNKEISEDLLKLDTEVSNVNLSDANIPTRLHSPEQKSSLKDRLYYILLLHFMGTDTIISANFMITLPSLIGQYAKPEYFDIAKEDIQTFNFYFVSIYIIGNITGGFLNSFLARRVRVSLFRHFLRVLIAISLIFALVPDKRILFTMRGFQGVFISLLESNNSAEAYKLSPKSLKGGVGNFFSFYFAIGVLIGEFLYYLSNKGILEWYWVFLILSFIELFSVALAFFYIGLDLSYTEYLEKGKKSEAREILSRFILTDCVEEMMDEETAFLVLDRKRRGKVNKSPLRIYFRELLLGLTINFFLSLSFLNSYSSNMVILTCRDQRDPEEATDFSFYASIAAVFEIVAKSLQLFVPALNNKRKRNLILGYSSICLLWLTNGYFYSTTNWKAQKVMIIFWFFSIGLIITPPAYSIMTDILIGELMGVVNSISRICDITVQFVFTLVLQKSSAESTFLTLSLIFSVIAGSAAIWAYLFFFETYGKSKVEIHRILYKEGTDNF